ncbi:MAG: hypothetical protein Q4G67_09415 [Actinomycetia bacterium]|nr:hypothetical protein [Actinomycetes bacterium]
MVTEKTGSFISTTGSLMLGLVIGAFGLALALWSEYTTVGWTLVGVGAALVVVGFVLYGRYRNTAA